MTDGERADPVDRCSFRLHRDKIPTDKREETMAGTRTRLDTDEDGYWECSHHAEIEGRCPFHAPEDARPDSAVVSREAIRRIRSTDPDLDRETRRDRKQFIGATVETLVLEDERFRGSDNFPIDLRCADIGTVQADSADFDVPVDLREATVDHFQATNSTWKRLFAQGATLRTSEFDQATIGRAYFDDSEMGLFRCYQSTIEYANFHGVTIDHANFLYAELGQVGFFDATIDIATFSNATVTGGAYLNDASFTYLNAEFIGGRSFHFSTIDAVGATFRGARPRKLRLDGSRFDRLRLERVDIDEAGAPEASLGVVSMADSRFGELDLTDVSFAGPLSLSGTTIDGSIELTPTTIGTNVGYVRCDGADIATGRLEQPPNDTIVYDFTDARIGSIDVGGETVDPLLSRLRFLNTDFDGFEFGKLPGFDLDAVGYEIHTLGYEPEMLAVNELMLATVTDLHSAVETSVLSGTGKYNVVEFEAIDGSNADVDTAAVARSRAERLVKTIPVDSTPATVPDTDVAGVELSEGAAGLRDRLQTVSPTPDARTLETTYLKAKNGASAVGDSTASGRFFQRERRYRRRCHRDAAQDPSRSLGHRVRRATQWGRNLLLGATTGYGERPLRVIGASIVTVALFTAVYLVTQPSLSGIENPGPIDYAVFSFQSFITFIVGPPAETTTLLVRVVSAVEGFVGAFFVALFVFTLTRQIHR